MQLLLLHRGGASETPSIGYSLIMANGLSLPLSVMEAQCASGSSRRHLAWSKQMPGAPGSMDTALFQEKEQHLLLSVPC